MVGRTAVGPSGAEAAAGVAAPATDRLSEAHARLLADRTLQWEFEVVTPPPEPPSWLRWLADLIGSAAPVIGWVFWAIVAVVIGCILLFIVREILRSRFPDRFRRKPKPEAAPAWRPETAVARALLSDADALAAQGRYAEAAHLLLLRSVDDIEGRSPRLLRPSLTSRDIAALPALPDAARRAFGFIAGIVELGFFGGRPVNAAGWSECREAYARFALPDGWGPEARAA